jgi:hypothetical protein
MSPSIRSLESSLPTPTPGRLQAQGGVQRRGLGAISSKVPAPPCTFSSQSDRTSETVTQTLMLTEEPYRNQTDDMDVDGLNALLVSFLVRRPVTLERHGVIVTGHGSGDLGSHPRH